MASRRNRSRRYSLEIKPIEKPGEGNLVGSDKIR